IYAEGSGFANSSYKRISSAASTLASDQWTKHTIASFFGRIGYNYSDRYFGEISLRTDGSSKFGTQNRWGTFPAVGLAWRIKNEAFLKDAGWVSDLKLRASYGITGNQARINEFAARGLWTGGRPYADVHGTPLAGNGPVELGNDELKCSRPPQCKFRLDAS